MGKHDETFREAIVENVQYMNDLFVAIVEAGISVFREDVDPRLLAKLVLSAVDSARSQYIYLGWENTPDGDKLVHILTDGTVARIRRRHAPAKIYQGLRPPV